MGEHPAPGVVRWTFPRDSVIVNPDGSVSVPAHAAEPLPPEGPRPMKRRVLRLHAMRAKWGDCYWKPGDDEHYPGQHECEDHEADLIEYENDVRADFTEQVRAAIERPGDRTGSPSHRAR